MLAYVHFLLYLCSMKKFYIETYGCQMNVADSEVVAAIMEMTDAQITDDIAQADIIILNTCSIRENAEQKVQNRLKLLFIIHIASATKMRLMKCFPV